MNKAEIKKSLEHWKRHFDEASNLYNNSITSQRATLAVSFGATALGLTVMKSLPQSDAILGIGTSLITLNVSLVAYANHHFSNYKKFYKAAKSIASQRYADFLNDNDDIDTNFITFEEFENNVANKTNLKRPSEKREYYINQSSILGLAASTGVAWYFAVVDPNDTKESRLENNSDVAIFVKRQDLVVTTAP